MSRCLLIFPILNKVKDLREVPQGRKRSIQKPRRLINFCYCCKSNNHEHDKCFFFAKKTRAEEEDFIKKTKLCFGCLKNINHYAKDCTNKLVCHTCGKSHPTSLHRSDEKPNERKQGKNPEETRNENSRNLNLMVKEVNKTACLTIPVILRSKVTKKLVKTYVGLDNFSIASYMDEHLLKDLGVTGKEKLR